MERTEHIGGKTPEYSAFTRSLGQGIIAVVA
jgi:hypothetical protein